MKDPDRQEETPLSQVQRSHSGGNNSRVQPQKWAGSKVTSEGRKLQASWDMHTLPQVGRVRCEQTEAEGRWHKGASTALALRLLGLKVLEVNLG